MKTIDFDFTLPETLIAQTPLDRRDASRLLVADKATGYVSHRQFDELPCYLQAGDCLVLNDSKVIPARLMGQRDTGGVVEVLLLRDRGHMVWECLTRPGRKTHTGTKVTFGAGLLTGVILEELDDGVRTIQLSCDGILMEVLNALGEMPLPPYIHEKLKNKERYQTVYARESGSAAAPTAGLHFTPELLDSIRGQGVAVQFVTLHVGLGTFRPVKAGDVTNHKMHREYYSITRETAAAIANTKAHGGRVIAVGTTTCRALESAAIKSSADPIGVRVGENSTDIFITPGYQFKIIDGLLTNFHLPQSTLMMLVSALLGHKQTMAAYEEAVAQEYRFFSFGDAMLIIDQK